MPCSEEGNGNNRNTSTMGDGSCFEYLLSTYWMSSILLNILHISSHWIFMPCMLYVQLDCKEGWTPENWCFQIVVLEKTSESPLDCKEIKPVNPKGNQSWVFIGRTVAEAEAPILWPSDEMSWLTRKDPEAGKVCRQKEKRAAEDEMVGWHHRLNGREFEQTERY